MVYRRGEEVKTWYRMDRIYMSDGQWFFSTREGEEVGPFATRGAAQNGVGAFLRHTKTAHTNGTYAAKVARAGLFATTLYR